MPSHLLKQHCINRMYSKGKKHTYYAQYHMEIVLLHGVYTITMFSDEWVNKLIGAKIQESTILQWESFPTIGPQRQAGSMGSEEAYVFVSLQMICLKEPSVSTHNLICPKSLHKYQSNLGQRHRRKDLLITTERWLQPHLVPQPIHKRWHEQMSQECWYRSVRPYVSGRPALLTLNTVAGEASSV